MAKQNVLIVEDEELMRSILRQLLEGAGYEVFSADSSETALEIFAGNDIAVTLTDIKMAGKDGLELLDEIKTIDESAVVIIMTAYSSVDSAIAADRPCRLSRGPACRRSTQATPCTPRASPSEHRHA